MMKFIQTHPAGGDCTAPYNVELDRPYTFGELVDEILTKMNGATSTSQAVGINIAARNAMKSPKKSGNFLYVTLKQPVGGLAWITQ